MCVPIGYINTLVTNTIGDSYRRESHINQQTDVAMSDSVDSYSFHSAGGTPMANFVVQIGFRERKYMVVFVEL